MDGGIATGSKVTPYYDPMLAKVIVHAEDRARALARMQLALADCVVLGVTTNVGYLQTILGQARFMDGDTPTNYLEQMLSEYSGDDLATDLPTTLLAIAAAEALRRSTKPRQSLSVTNASDPWELATGWRNV